MFVHIESVLQQELPSILKMKSQVFMHVEGAENNGSIANSFENAYLKSLTITIFKRNKSLGFSIQNIETS